MFRRPLFYSTFTVLAGLFIVTANVQAQSSDTLTVPYAISHLQAGRFAQAAVVLDAVTEREPENSRAWSLLGLARRSSGDLDGAIEAYEKLRMFEPSVPTALFNLGLIHAQKDDLDTAFDYLQQADETGQVNMTQLMVGPTPEALREDPRFATLLPTEAEFADPFVESVAIIHEWRGETTGDQFGWIARNIGDVDGDGTDDVTTSAPSFGSGGNGKVYVYSSGSGALLWSAVGDSAAGLGLGIEAAGDVNADGIPDVIAGAPGVERAYVYSGNDGEVVHVFEGDSAGAIFGRKVSDFGDVNGDGYADVLVGEPGYRAGRMHVFSGQDGASLLVLNGESAGDAFGSSAGGYVDEDHTLIVVGAPNAGPQNGGRTYVYTGLTDTPAFVIEADSTGSALGGMFVSVVGDVNADGTPDVYASDWANAAKGPTTGRAYIHSGADGSHLYTFTGEAAGDGFGIGVADAGDVDEDGHDDLVIGAWQHAGAAPSGGKVYLYSGKDGSLTHAYTGKVEGETFGFDATGMGDVNGDGVIDLLLTSAWSAINGGRSGRMFIVSGQLGN